MPDTSDAIEIWEAHRAGGGGVERPESCMLSFDYGWSFGGRPEADVHATRDGVLVSVHDDSIARIARAIPPELQGRAIAQMTWDELQRCEIGSDAFPGQHVVSLAQL